MSPDGESPRASSKSAGFRRNRPRAAPHAARPQAPALASAPAPRFRTASISIGSVSEGSRSSHAICMRFEARQHTFPVSVRSSMTSRRLSPDAVGRRPSHRGTEARPAASTRLHTCARSSANPGKRPCPEGVGVGHAICPRVKHA